MGGSGSRQAFCDLHPGQPDVWRVLPNPVAGARGIGSAPDVDAIAAWPQDNALSPTGVRPGTPGCNLADRAERRAVEVCSLSALRMPSEMSGQDVGWMAVEVVAPVVVAPGGAGIVMAGSASCTSCSGIRALKASVMKRPASPVGCSVRRRASRCSPGGHHRSAGGNERRTRRRA
jgi:hypothetical protein